MESSRHGVQRKQDKSSIHKHSPLDLEELKSLSSKKSILKKQKIRKGWSNSMLGNNQIQRGRMSIRKGNPKDKSKSNSRKTISKSSALGTIQQASFKMANRNKSITDNKLKSVTEEPESCLESQADMQIDKPAPRSPVRSGSGDNVLLRNTPKKSSPLLNGPKDDEFEF